MVTTLAASLHEKFDRHALHSEPDLSHKPPVTIRLLPCGPHLQIISECRALYVAVANSVLQTWPSACSVHARCPGSVNKSTRAHVYIISSLSYIIDGSQSKPPARILSTHTTSSIMRNQIMAIFLTVATLATLCDVAGVASSSKITCTQSVGDFDSGLISIISEMAFVI